MASFLRRNPRIHVTRILSSTLSTSAVEKPLMTSFRKVKSAIRSESDPDKLAEIFQQSSDLSRFCRDRALFNLSVLKLSRSGRLDLIERILLYQEKSPVLKSEGFWIRIMMLYSNARMFDQAVRTFERIEELGCKRTEKSLCALLSVYLDSRQFNLVHESFKSVPSKIGVSPGVVAYNIVLKAFCQEKLVGSAHSLLDTMEKENGVKPNITSYNILLSGYLRNGDETKFDEILNEISEMGLNPDLGTYNHRISRLCRNKECVRARKLLDEMVLKGIKPNSTSFNNLIDGFCKIADFESAKKVFESMCSNDSVSPNSDTYVTLIRHMVEEGEFDSALAMCKESIRRNWVPPFASMEGLVNGLLKISKVDEAKEVVEKMKEKLRGSAADSWKKVEGLLPL